MSRPNGIGKTMNDYARELDGVHGSASNLYEAAPKAVIAAVAVSFIALTHPEGVDSADREFLHRSFIREWWALHENGIVPQRPPFPKPAEEV